MKLAMNGYGSVWTGQAKVDEGLVAITIPEGDAMEIDRDELMEWSLAVVMITLAGATVVSTVVGLIAFVVWLLQGTPQ